MRNERLNLLSGIMFCILFILTCGGGSGSSSSAPTPNIYIAQTTIDFGGTVLNNYIDRTFIIKNNGNVNLNIGQISIPTSTSPFSISSDTASNKTLTPNQTYSLMIRFSPTSQGSSTGTFSIPSNDPDSPTVIVALKGEGYGLNVWINQINTEKCPEINLDVTVTGPSGPLTELTSGNFMLKQNGEQRSFDFTTNPISDSVSVVLALDFSGSLTTDLEAIKSAAKSFIDLLAETDEAAICRFKSEIEFFPETVPPYFQLADDFTGKGLLKDYIDTSFDAADGTVLYDAVYNSIDRATEGTKDKLVVIILSDGVNTTTGENTLQEAIDYAKFRGIPVFSIFYVDLNVYPNATPEVMQQLANDTGGQYYNSDDDVELQNIFIQISSVLTNKYTITYSRFSLPCTGSIDLEVRADSDGLYGLDSRTVALP